jgi:hypothetical protein
MRNQKGYVAGYNGQAVVTADQVIVGAVLSQHPVDRTLLHPVLDACRQQLTQAGIRPKLRTVLGDAGYASEENFARAGQDKLRLLVPLAKDPGRPGGRAPKRARHLDQYPATARAARRMRHPKANGYWPAPPTTCASCTGTASRDEVKAGPRRSEPKIAQDRDSPVPQIRNPQSAPSTRALCNRLIYSSEPRSENGR